MASTSSAWLRTTTSGFTSDRAATASRRVRATLAPSPVGLANTTFPLWM
jgi:hypothetical protein